ncbi:hypothetical protein NOK12_29890 [Nocardioides sp. OK12]|nr:hypothetical protein NOK12_29890 [Nocardioides sp. OK12]
MRGALGAGLVLAGRQYPAAGVVLPDDPTYGVLDSAQRYPVGGLEHPCHYPGFNIVVHAPLPTEAELVDGGAYGLVDSGDG